MINLKEKYRQYKKWQKTPFVVAPNSTETHICKTCQTEYVGNFCPRCSQSAKVGRFSFQKIFFYFLDAWGFGNRGLFRTLRDLIFRPGYLIQDYLKGMRMAYYPPFKLFFILITLSVLISHGFNIKRENNGYITEIQTSKETTNTNEHGTVFINILDYLSKLKETNPAIVSLISTTTCSWIFFLFFRKSKYLGKMGFAEFFIAMIYINNVISIYSVVQKFFCLNYSIVSYIVILLSIIPFKQLSGYSWIKTIFRLSLSVICIMIFLMLIAVAVEIPAYLL